MVISNTELELKLKQLDAANRHIAHAEAEVAAQRRRIARLEAESCNTERERKLLSAMLDALATMQQHRIQISETIDRLRNEAGGGPAKAG